MALKDRKIAVMVSDETDETLRKMKEDLFGDVAYAEMFRRLIRLGLEESAAQQAQAPDGE